MADRADAHIHLFEGGYQASFIKRLGIAVDEAVLYDSLVEEHGVTAALIVGYADLPWCADNHNYLVKMQKKYDWVYPATYVDATQPPIIEDLERFQSEGFVGITLYISGDDRVAALLKISDEVWEWLASRNWLVSVNSSGEAWIAWQQILGRHASLRLVMSHLGGPTQVGSPPSEDGVQEGIGTVLDLATYPEARVKLSGFYAITDPRHDYPHRATWPYVEALKNAFGVERLLWASDFTPSLDWLSFPQTLGLFGYMPFLSDTDCEKIEGGNLLALLDEVE
jgi:L-fuconolactonase